MSKKIPLYLILSLQFAIQVIAIVGLVGYLSYRSGQQAVERLANELIDEQGKRINQHLNSYLGKAQEINQANLVAYESGILNLNDFDSLGKYFYQQVKLFDFSFVNFGAKNGSFIAAGYSTGLPEAIIAEIPPDNIGVLTQYQVDQQGNRRQVLLVKNNTDRINSPWYLDAVKAKKNIWSAVYNWGDNASNIISISASLPVYDPQQELLGVLGIDLQLNQISDFLAHLKNNVSQHIFIIERSGLVIVTSENESRAPIGKATRLNIINAEDLLIREVAQYLKQQYSDFKNISKTELLNPQLSQSVFIKVIPYQDDYGLDWFLVNVVPESAFLGEIKANANRTFGLCILALIIAITTSVLTSRKITRSLSLLTNATYDFTKNLTVKSIPPSLIKEVAHLSESFEKMMRIIDDGEKLKRNYTLELEQQIKEKTKALVEAQKIAHVGSWEFDLITQEVIWSEELYRIYEALDLMPIFRPDQTIQKIHPDDLERFENLIAIAVKKGQTFDTDLKIITKKNNIRYVQTKGKPVLDEEGKVIKYIGTVADITDRKKAQLALQKNQVRFQKLANASPAVIYTVKEDIAKNLTRFDYVSPAVEKIMELTIPEILADGKLMFETIHPDDLEGYIQAVKQSLETMAIFQYEWRVITPSGKIKWLCGNSTPEKQNNGEIVWHGIVIDITDRKKAEIKLARQQEILETMSCLGRIGAWEYDVINQKLYWSKMTKELHEVSPDFEPDLETGINFYKEGKNRDTIRQVIQLAIDEGISWDLELEFVTAKGQEIWVGTIGKAEFENGVCVRLFGSFQDITHRKKIEAELQKLSQRLGVALKSGAIGCWEWDINTNVIVWDERMYELYGLTKTYDTVGYDVWANGVHPEDRPATERILHQTVLGKAEYNPEFRVVHPDGSIYYIQAYGIVIQDNQGNPQSMIGVNFDITERKQNEQALSLAKEAAEAATIAKSQFLASMSHEIRTPLNGVLGMLHLLQETSLNSEQKMWVRTAQSSGESLLNLINDILDFSKVEAGKLELENIDFNLPELLGDFVKLIAFKAQEKGLELILDLSKLDLVNVKGDPNRLQQILTNLMGNAIKFTEQGEIVISVMRETAQLLFQENLPLSPLQRGEEHTTVVNNNIISLQFIVEDTGIGIPDHKIPTLFESFTQVDSSTTRKYGGTGLGLTIVKKLCQLMGGNITVESELGKGSKFIFTIKLESPTHSISNLSIPNLKNSNILIIDDNITHLKILSNQLQKWGANVTTINHSNQFNDIQLTPNGDQPLFDLAFIDLDLQIPEQDGLIFGKNIKADQRFQNMKLILMNNVSNYCDPKKIKNFGFTYYLNKPITIIELINIFNSLENSEHLREQLSPDNLDLSYPNHPVNTSSLKPLINFEHNHLLVVEDNKTNQLVITGFLRYLGLKADIANDGIEALNLVKNSTNHPYDLIFMDCQLPNMDGYEATRQIRQGCAGEAYKNINIIAMTANALQGDREKCLETGMNDYLSKPINPTELKNILTKWLLGGESTFLANLPENKTSETPKLKIFEEQILLEYCQFSEEMQREIYQIFLEEIIDYIQEIKTWLDKENSEELQRFCQKINPAILQVGGVRLHQLIVDLEKADQTENFDIKTVDFFLLEQEFFRLKEALENWLKRWE
jgi:PAS domain S-box-containing protein